MDAGAQGVDGAREALRASVRDWSDDIVQAARLPSKKDLRLQQCEALEQSSDSEPILWMDCRPELSIHMEILELFSLLSLVDYALWKDFVRELWPDASEWVDFLETRSSVRVGLRVVVYDYEADVGEFCGLVVDSLTAPRSYTETAALLERVLEKPLQSLPVIPVWFDCTVVRSRLIGHVAGIPSARRLPCEHNEGQLEGVEQAINNNGEDGGEVQTDSNARVVSDTSSVRNTSRDASDRNGSGDSSDSDDSTESRDSSNSSESDDSANISEIDDSDTTGDGIEGLGDGNDFVDDGVDCDDDGHVSENEGSDESQEYEYERDPLPDIVQAIHDALARQPKRGHSSMGITRMSLETRYLPVDEAGLEALVSIRNSGVHVVSISAWQK